MLRGARRRTRAPRDRRVEAGGRRGLLALFLVGAVVAGGRPKAGARQETPVTRIHVDTVEVRALPMPRTLALTGTLRGQRQTDLAANAAGRVLETFVERGAEVKQGGLLARLDVRAAALTAA